MQTQAWIQLTNGHLLHNNYLPFSVNSCVVALFSHLYSSFLSFTRPDNYFSHSWPSWMHDSEIELAKLSNSVYQNEHQLNISTLQTFFSLSLITHFFFQFWRPPRKIGELHVVLGLEDLGPVNLHQVMGANEVIVTFLMGVIFTQKSTKVFHKKL